MYTKCIQNVCKQNVSHISTSFCIHFVYTVSVWVSLQRIPPIAPLCIFIGAIQQVNNLRRGKEYKKKTSQKN